MRKSILFLAMFTLLAGPGFGAGPDPDVTKAQEGIPIGSPVYTHTTMVKVINVADDTTAAFPNASIATPAGGNVIGFCIFPDQTATPTTLLDIYLYADDISDTGLTNATGAKVDLLGGTGVDIDTSAPYTCKQVQLGGKDVPFPFTGSQTLVTSGNAGTETEAEYALYLFYQ